MKMSPANYKALKYSPDTWYCENCNQSPNPTSNSSTEYQPEVNNTPILASEIISSTPCPTSPILQHQHRDWDSSLYISETPQTRINPLGNKLKPPSISLHSPKDTHSTLPTANTTPVIFDEDVNGTQESECLLDQNQVAEEASQPEQRHILQPEITDTEMLSIFPNVPMPADTTPDTIIEDQEPSSSQEPPISNVKPSLPDITVKPMVDDDCTEDIWGNIPYNELHFKLNQIYDEIVFYRKKHFKVPSGKCGKQFIEELTFWIRQLNRNTKLNKIAMKVFMVLPTILLQKPSSKSKAKQHTEALERRLNQWRAGQIDSIMREMRMIQSRFKSSTRSNQTETTSKRFAKLMMEGKVSAAMKLLDNTSSSGVLNLTEEVMEELRHKHPEAANAKEGTLLHGPLFPVPECFYEPIDEQTIMKAAMDTRGSAGPSGMDAEQYRRVLCSKNFSKAGKNLREEIALLARNLASKHYHPELLDAYVSSRLIPLDKDPGLRPIGVGEVLRRIIGKSISRLASDAIKDAAGPLQTCAGHGAGAEAAIHAMYTIFKDEGTDAVLLIDATNAFNRLNRTAALHNIQIICPLISTYVVNTYRHPSRLFIAGGKTILSMEGTTQGDPLAMPWYSLCTTTLIQYLASRVAEVKQVWLADDASAAGRLILLKEWFDHLEREGKKHGYDVNGGKSWLIVKSEEMKQQAKEIFGDSVNITADGKRHLGAVIGSEEYKREFCEEKVQKWTDELTILTEIAETHPQMAYAAFQKGYKSKFTYFLRTIENFHQYVEPLDAIISDKLIPTMFGYDSPMAEIRNLLSLNSSDGGLGFPIIAEVSEGQYKSSKLVSLPLVESIIAQESIVRSTSADGRTSESLRSTDRKNKIDQKKEAINAIDSSLPENLASYVKQARDKGASSWLNALPIEEMAFTLNKEQFRDALRLRYNLSLDNLPSTCPCGQRFDVRHALTCKKGGFIHERHDNIKNTLTVLMSKVCNDVEEEPHLIPVTNEVMYNRTANTQNDARLDIKANSFWQKGQTAFFDIRVTHVNSQSQKHMSTEKIFRVHEQAKKREYMQRVLEIENGSFTPLVFGTNGGLGEECASFLTTLASKIAMKDGESYAHTITWIRTRLSFEILKAAITCVRGSRVPFRRKAEVELKDFEIMSNQGDLKMI